MRVCAGAVEACSKGKINPNLVAPARTFLEARWLDYWQKQIGGAQNFRKGGEKRSVVPEPLSTCMCQHTSLFLLRLLGKDWRVVGGQMSDNHKIGLGHDHWWLVIDDTILDLTADQFGWSAIIITNTGDRRYSHEDELSRKSWLRGTRYTVALWEAAPGYDELVKSMRLLSLAMTQHHKIAAQI